MRRPRRSCLAAGLLGLACLLSAGCGDSNATVSGQVTYQGKAVPSGSVIVYCADKQIVRGVIGVDGRYSIPNVPTGQAVVTVEAHARVPSGLRMKQKLPPSSGGPIAPTVEAPETGKTSLPPRYALPEESGLRVVVDRGRVTYDIDLQP